ncbi:MAG TPA: formylglycine-generating enzyme family protein, partial [Lacunisphaera sp.]|nr:formylglycine-generating enzyme family protein [Lacunisphaera sp.]
MAGKEAPVENVSWLDAMEFCRRITERERAEGRLPEGYVYTLPSEAQWEYACRAGTRTPHAGELDNVAWFNKAGGKTTRAVAQKAANAWGFHDMHGNVWEWCLEDFVDRLPGGNVTDYALPTKPGARHAYRGGGWNNAPEDCRSAKRVEADAEDREENVGFRLALSLPPVAPVVSEEAKRSGTGFGATVKSTFGGLLRAIKPGDARAPSASSGLLNVVVRKAPPAPFRFTLTLVRVGNAAESLEFLVDEMVVQGRTAEDAFAAKLTVPPGVYTFALKTAGFRDETQGGAQSGAGPGQDQIEIKAGNESSLELELKPLGEN